MEGVGRRIIAPAEPLDESPAGQHIRRGDIVPAQKGIVGCKGEIGAGAPGPVDVEPAVGEDVAAGLIVLLPLSLAVALPDPGDAAG